MKITFYGYNAFIIETSDKTIAIDPGADLYFFRFKSLIPKNLWKEITHIFITHGDPDHHWYTDKISEASNAEVICNKNMVKTINGNELMLGPRSKGLAFTKKINNIHTISFGETIEVDEMKITGVKAEHGPITFKLGPFSKTLYPGPDERMGHGSIGFKIYIDNMNIVNLGDTLLHTSEWKVIENCDVLMIPIGGKVPHNTMDEKEALEAVEFIKPKLVIPCHYNCPALFSKKYNPADDNYFREGVEKMGHRCAVLERGESIKI